MTFSFRSEKKCRRKFLVRIEIGKKPKRIGIENFNDVKIGDVFECYRTEEVARTLDQAAKS